LEGNIRGVVEVLSQYLLGKPEKNHKNSVRISGVLKEIRKDLFHNTT
jgi:hypothetical protein